VFEGHVDEKGVNMQKRYTLLAALLLMSVLIFSVIEAGSGKGKVPCSVCGFMIEKSEASTKEHDGTTYYFCDAGCKAYFIEAPEIVKSGMTVDPVCGKNIKKGESIDIVYKGWKVDFCSEACRKKYLENPDEYEMNYDVVAHRVGYVKDMKHIAEFEGRPYYFFSEDSKSKFLENPDVYVYAECPIGGDVFLRKDAAGTRVFEGKKYYFGCQGCLAIFDKDPEGSMKGDGKQCPRKKSIKCPHAKDKECPHKKDESDCSKSKGADKCPM